MVMREVIWQKSSTLWFVARSLGRILSRSSNFPEARYRSSLVHEGRKGNIQSLSNTPVSSERSAASRLLGRFKGRSGCPTDPPTATAKLRSLLVRVYYQQPHMSMPVHQVTRRIKIGRGLGSGVKYLPCKLADLSSVPRTYVKAEREQ